MYHIWNIHEYPHFETSPHQPFIVQRLRVTRYDLTIVIADKVILLPVARALEVQTCDTEAETTLMRPHQPDHWKP